VRGFVLVVVLTLGVAARVDAQPGLRLRDAGFIGKDVTVLEVEDCPAVPDVSPEELRRIGSEHFERGEVLYVQGDYKGAVKELVAAYCIFPYYTILKDIGQAYERELDYAKAIAYLERYVIEVPRDAQRLGPCSPDPQIDRDNVVARIRVLKNLTAKIRVNTEPDDARVTLSDHAGVVASRGESGVEHEVLGGTYTILVEADGYAPVTREVRADIGKPYTLFERLEPLRGHLRVRAIPADARIFLDDKQVGTGLYDALLPGGRYKLSVEAPGRVTSTRDIEVLPERDHPISIELDAQPQFGRRQLVGYATGAGAVAFGALATAQDNPALITGGVLAGAAAGFLGTTFGTRRDLALGTSSLAITASLIGGVVGGTSSIMLTDRSNVVGPMIGGGLLLGGGIGFYAGERLGISPGDAALINSGAVWGTVAGTLLAISFDADERISGGFVLSGLGMGTIGGALFTRYFTVSRGRAAVIDVGGVLGAFVGVAVESVIGTAADSEARADTGSVSNYMLGGVAAGLIGAALLTRNMDEPALAASAGGAGGVQAVRGSRRRVAVTPVVGRTLAAGDGSTAPTFGVAGGF
jgi:tetratricopeptide (TPR) repeat protein